MNRKFDRLVISAVIGTVCVTAAASIFSPLHGVTASPRVAYQPAAAEVALREQVAQPQEDTAEVATLEAEEPHLALNDAHRLADRFAEMGYDLDLIRGQGKPVPRIFLAKLPENLHAVPEVSLKKTVFFQTMLPLILQENDRIRKDRDRLYRLRTDMRLGHKLEARDRLWLAVLAERYKVKDDSVDELLRRVDIVPPSLAMAQAAEESGWGTSRFAQHGNALFGQWTTASGEGLVPEDREEGMEHKVRRFGTLTQSVAAYMRNLNTHRAYRGFRADRQAMRGKGISPDGWTLADALQSYSARGEKYVGSIRTIIDSNDLRALDGARLTEDASDDTAA